MPENFGAFIAVVVAFILIGAALKKWGTSSSSVILPLPPSWKLGSSDSTDGENDDIKGKDSTHSH